MANKLIQDLLERKNERKFFSYFFFILRKLKFSIFLFVFLFFLHHEDEILKYTFFFIFVAFARFCCKDFACYFSSRFKNSRSDLIFIYLPPSSSTVRSFSVSRHRFLRLNTTTSLHKQNTKKKARKGSPKSSFDDIDLKFPFARATELVSGLR